MCYQQSLDRFKSTHLNNDNKFNKKSKTIVSQIINAGIVQQMRSNRYLQRQLQLNSHVGEVFAGGDSKIVESTLRVTSIDKVFLRRFVGYHEFIFNEVAQDRFDQFDFQKPEAWHVCHDLSAQDINQH